MIANGELIEYAVVYGQYKGVPTKHLDKALEAMDHGQDVLMRLDVQGAETIRQMHPEALLIFISTPSQQELLERLRQRSTESPEQLQIRLRTAQQETEQIPEFDYVVPNADGKLDQTSRHHPIHHRRRKTSNPSAPDPTMNQSATVQPIGFPMHNPASSPTTTALDTAPSATSPHCHLDAHCHQRLGLAGHDCRWAAAQTRRVLVVFGAKVNELIVQGQLWRLVTPIFLHIGIVHLAFNTYAIYVFGSQIERFFGTARFVGLYLLSGIAGVLASFSFSPHPSAGASSAIFGLIGTEAAFFYRYRNAFGRRGQQRLYNILIVIGYNLAFTFVASNIDVWGHLGGLVAGAVLSWWLMPRMRSPSPSVAQSWSTPTAPVSGSQQCSSHRSVSLVCAVLAVSLRAAQY